MVLWGMHLIHTYMVKARLNVALREIM